jgi:gamma-glutamyltranspeptidase/glutathione hydrolase
MPKIAIASGSQISADAGAAIASQGGNAVDAALTATLVSMCTDLGVMAPGASGFITIWSPKQAPVVIDAYAEMPGRGLPLERFGQGMREVSFDYGGQMSTFIGYGSVATPGIFAGLATASKQYGHLPWQTLVEPARHWVQEGFPLTGGAAEYLAYTHDAIFSWHPTTYRVLHHPDGSCLSQGEIVRIPELAQSLRLIGEEGANTFYTGEIGQQIAREIQSNEGLLTMQDLQAYQAKPLSPICIRIGDWEVITNPPPAIGGACVAAMLLMLEGQSLSPDNLAGVKQMAQIQKAVLDYRLHHLEPSSHSTREAKVAHLLKWSSSGRFQNGLTSPSTIHISAVDSNGLACAITASAGYGSGVMIADTGLLLNNSLGEIELHPQPIQSLTPGTRLISNMAPTIARRSDGTILAIGSPGASRITTAIVQVLHNFLHLKMSLSEAISYPRLHVEIAEGLPNIAFEAGLPANSLEDFVPREFPQLSMYFGGVQAALWHHEQGLLAAADPRRAGGIAYGGFP